MANIKQAQTQLWTSLWALLWSTATYHTYVTLKTQMSWLSFSSSITIVLMFTQGSNYCWYQEDSIHYALKICLKSPHFATWHHNLRQNLEESSLFLVIHILYQTHQWIMLPLDPKNILNPVFIILVQVIIFPYTWAISKASKMPSLWLSTHSHPPQTSNGGSDHISSTLGNREYLISSL